MTGSSSKIEGLIQVLRESGYTILEVSRTGRMAMRRGKHTSRVLKALGTNGPVQKVDNPDLLPEPWEPTPHVPTTEIIPNQFPDVHEEEE
jgi:acetolactate synthase-1/3 small subunit